MTSMNEEMASICIQWPSLYIYFNADLLWLSVVANAGQSIGNVWLSHSVADSATSNVKYVWLCVAMCFKQYNAQCVCVCNG